MHSDKGLWTLNLISCITWAICFYLLLDSHVPKFPINSLISRGHAFKKKGSNELVLPVWGLMSLFYLGGLVLHMALQLCGDRLPGRMQGLTRLVRKENMRAADHFFPFGEDATHRPDTVFCVCMCVVGAGHSENNTFECSHCRSGWVCIVSQA